MPIPTLETQITTETAIDFSNSKDRAELTRRWKTMRKSMMLDELLVDLRTVRQMADHFTNDGQDLQSAADMDNRLLEAEWDMIYHMKSDQLLALFRRDLSGALQMEWEALSDDIAHVLLGEYSLGDRQKVKNQIVELIRESSATIGEGQIILGGESTDPSIANWLRDVRDFTGGTDPDPLQIIEYINGNQNAQKLSDEERATLEGVLKLIVELQIPSTQNGGYENTRIIPDMESGNYMVYSNGRVEDSGIAVEEAELAEMRRVIGLREDGSPTSLAEHVKDAVVEGRYALPTQLQNIVDSVRPEEHVPAAAAVEATPEAAPEMPEELEMPELAPALPKEDPVEMDTVPAPTDVEALTAELPPLVPETPESSEMPLPAPEMPTIVVPPASEMLQSAEELEMPAPEAPVVPEPTMPEPPHMPVAPAPMPPAPEPVAPAPKPAPTPAAPALANQVEQKGAEQVDYNELAQRVLAEFNILFADFQQEKNFVSIVASYLRGVRDRQEAYEGLARSPEEGGVDLSVEQIDEVLDTAEFMLNDELESPQSRRANVKKQKSAGPRPTLAMVQEKIKKQREEQEENWSAVPVAKRDAEEGGVEDIFSNVGGEGTTSLTPVAPAEMPTEPNLPVGDISKEELPTVMGPMEELEHMTLTEFRQFGSDPVEASHQILEKIDLLAQESIQKKTSGIEAWKKSPLNKLYVAIGNRSFNDAIPVEQAIAQMEAEGERILSQDEFHAIADMNKQLRF